MAIKGHEMMGLGDRWLYVCNLYICVAPGYQCNAPPTNSQFGCPRPCAMSSYTCIQAFASCSPSLEQLAQ